MDLLEVLSGCEMPNKYYAYDLGHDKEGKPFKKGASLFKAVE